MNIFLVSPGMEHDGNTLKERSLGGSETAAIQLARELAKLTDPFGQKNRVTVFSPCRDIMEADGVTYIPVQAAQAALLQEEVDLLIVSRWPEVLARPTVAKATLMWCHDLATKRREGIFRGVAWQVDKALVMSNFQKKQYVDTYQMQEEDLEVIRNGIDLGLFPPLRGYQERDIGQMVYAARPERGLENLVRPGGIMDRLLAKNVPVHLYVAGYDNTTDEMRPYYESLWARCNELPNVTRLPHLTKEQLYDLYSRSWIYIYPTDFEEISCISAMEAMACGLPFVTTPTAALPETLGKEAAIFLNGPARSEASIDSFVNTVQGLLQDEARWKRLSMAGMARAGEFDWEPVAKQVLELGDRIIRERTADPVRLYKHFYERSDIEACRRLEEKHRDSASFQFRTAREREKINAGWYFLKSPEEYQGHYERVDAGAKVEQYESSEAEPRMMFLANFLRIHGRKFKRVLDVGSWIGHQTIRVANLLPHAEVVGVDITPRNIELGQECILRHAKNKNVKLVLGTLAQDWALSFPGDDEPFDLVLMNEVLEHVPDQELLIRQAEGWCRQGGTIFLTTPSGPWESLSYDTFPWRCHIRHHDRQDLVDLFGQKEELSIVHKATGSDPKGLPLGHHYVAYKNNADRPTGQIDWSRKLAYQAPLDTVAVCLIAYNAEDMLHRCLKSVRGIADEIIVAIDPKTTDSTAEIAAKHGAILVEGIDPIKDGFEEARNRSIGPATSDWIIWLDSDEELLGANRLARYLRQGMYDGYGISQHHLSVDPPMAVRPDLPIRAFRNGKGIRFFGVVHEHPEKGINEGVGPAITLNDVWIAHDGYLTEEIRRNRFLRNIDLVFRDRQKYPDRVLGHFLELRDYIHLVRYRGEQLNGGPPDAQAMEWARKAADLFEKHYIMKPQDPMYQEGLGYYSDANRILGKGVPLRVQVQIEGQQPNELRGQFGSAEKAGESVGKLIKEMLSIFEHKYF